MLGAVVAPLPVHDHGAGEHQPADPGFVHRGQQHSGAEIVVSSVVGPVGRVEAVPDHRRLMAHGIHPGQQPAQQVGVADVPADQLVRGGPGRQSVSMRLRQQQVQQDDVVPVGGESISHVGTNEPRPTRDQNPHPAERSVPSGSRCMPRCSAQCRPDAGAEGSHHEQLDIHDDCGLPRLALVPSLASWTG